MKIIGDLALLAGIALNVVAQIKFNGGDNSAFVYLNTSMILFVLATMLMKQPREDKDE